ncbi:MAG: putative transcriptional regulator [Roseivirga sp.]|jgi:predicted transcriptional regulator
MRVDEHILNDFSALGITERVADLLSNMGELKISHMPIIHEGQYLGLISEEDLLDVENTDDNLEKHLKVLKPYSIRAEDHLYAAIKTMAEGNLSCLPVLNEEKKYIGYLSPQELIFDLGRQLSYNELGSVIVLRIAIHDYYISKISQIIESEGALILGLQLNKDGNDFILVSLKINQQDLSRILKSFERFEYDVVEVYHQTLFEDDSDPFEALVKYLNI